MSKVAKTVFIDQFGSRIRVLFNTLALLGHKEVIIKISSRQVGEFANCFVPWYKNGDSISTDIELVASDTSFHALRLKDAAAEQLLLAELQPYRVPPQKLQPVILMTDSTSKHTLILDSNHTLTALYKWGAQDQPIPTVEIIGRNMADVVVDLNFL